MAILLEAVALVSEVSLEILQERKLAIRAKVGAAASRLHLEVNLKEVSHSLSERGAR